MSKRIGCFRVNGYFVDFEPIVVMALMSRVIVTACSYNSAIDEYEYRALSPEFDEIDDDAEIPRYFVIVDTDKLEICFEKVA